MGLSACMGSRGVHSPAAAAGYSPSQGCLESQEMLSILLLPPPHAPCWEGVSSRRGWQTPAQLRRQNLSSDTISAKHSLKVKIKCKEATELSSPSWWENPPLISASLFQALQTKPDFSFPSPCPDNPQCCSHTDTGSAPPHISLRDPRKTFPAGPRSSSSGCLAGSRCHPLHAHRVLLERKAQTHPERCLCSPAQPVQRQHPQRAQGAAVYISPCPRCRKQQEPGRGAAPLPSLLGFVGWHGARPGLHFPAGIAQQCSPGLAPDAAAVTLRRGLGAVPSSGAPSVLVLEP